MNNNNKNLQEALRSLNSTQRQAVLSNAISLQIVAGPGSGKTKGFFLLRFFNKNLLY